jgi:hypothetical protein
VKPVRIIGVALLLGACWGGEPSQPPVTTTLPRLTPVAVAGDLEAVGGTTAAVQVGPQGVVLVRGISGAPRALSVHHPASGWQYLVSEGDAPGELRMAMPLAVTDSSFLAWGLGALQVAEWSLTDGRWLGQVPAQGAIAPAFLADGRGIVGTTERRDGTIPVLLDQATGKVRPLITTLDSAYRRVFPRRDAFVVRFGNPAVVGEWPGGFLIGNGFSYQLLAYDWSGRFRYAFGRDVPVNRRSPAQVEQYMTELARSALGQHPDRLAAARERAAQDSVRWFSHLSSPRHDAEGRVWIIGTAGDTTFADLFAEAKYLGRLVLDCPGFRGRSAVNGRWLALLCATEDDRDGALHLMRIEG